MQNNYTVYVGNKLGCTWISLSEGFLTKVIRIRQINMMIQKKICNCNLDSMWKKANTITSLSN
jgi:hypothetical protein